MEIPQDRLVVLAAVSVALAVSVASVVPEDRVASVVLAVSVASAVPEDRVASVVSVVLAASVVSEGVPDGACFSSFPLV